MTRDPDAPDPRDLDGDPLSGPVPAPDQPPDAGERARARGFGDLVDKVVAGRAPAAVPAEERALLEVATAIRAATRPVELPRPRVSSLVESALATAIDRKAGGPARTTVPTVPVVPLAPRAGRSARALPWMVTGASSLVAAAAVAVLVLRAPARPAPAPAPVAASLPASQRSRPADPLIGAIARDRAGDAAGRLDVIYADRLDGFRQRTLSPARPHRAGATP